MEGSATLLGLSASTWSFINTFAPWFSAAGTIAAVLTSLHLARAQRRTRLRIFADYRVLVGPGLQGSGQEGAFISVTNAGPQPVRLLTLGWRVGGMFKRRHGYQTVAGLPYSSELPIDLLHGQAANWFLPDAAPAKWAETFAKEFLMPNWRRSLETTRVSVYTTIGYGGSREIDRSLREHLADVCRRLEQSDGNLG